MADTLANRLNNPGNLKDPATGTFRSFASPQEGYAALMNDLQGKVTGKTSTGLTPASTLVDFAKTYAPSNDQNNPAQYAANLANKLKVRPDTQIGSLQSRLGEFADAIAHNEGYQSSQPQQPSAASNVPFVPTANAQTPNPDHHEEPDKDWMHKTADVLGGIFGGDKIGDFIGTQIAKFNNPEQAKYLLQPTAGQVLGDVGQAALTVLPLGRAVGAATKGAGLISKVAQGVKAVTGAEKVLAPAVGGLAKTARVAKGLASAAGLGAGFGASQALKNKTSITEGALSGGALGFGVGVVGQVAGKLLQSFPRWAVGSALKGSSPEQIQTALSKKFLTIDKGVVETQNDIDKIDGSIQKLLTKSKYPLTTAARVKADNLSLIDRAIKGYTNRAGEAVEGFPMSNYKPEDLIANARKLVPEHEKLVDKLANNQANLQEIDQLRSAIDRRVALVYKPGHAVAPESKNLGAALAGSLRDYVKTTVPKSVPLFDEYAKNINLSKLLKRIQLKSPGVKAFGFRDIMAMIAGGGVGGVPGAIGMTMVNRAAQSPTIELAGARALQKAAPGLRTTGLLGKLAALKGGAAASTQPNQQ